VQTDHIHLIVEAPDKRGLSGGAAGLAVRIARGLNRLLGRRGALWGDRWNGRALKTPRAVRHALVYVLANHKKHLDPATSPGDVDPCSSAPWFSGWSGVAPWELETLRAGLDPPVHESATWLGATGWRKLGLLARWERPKG
jgi:putative transposase